MPSPHALVVSGGGRFTDPWHPFADTSEALAATLRARGHSVTIQDDPDAALADLSAASRPDLLVLNIGWFGPDSFTGPATDGLVAALRSGTPTLLTHSTLTGFRTGRCGARSPAAAGPTAPPTTRTTDRGLPCPGPIIR